MQQISRETSLFELAALVSEKLSNAGIIAVLSGGSAVSAYTDNQYQSVDLDFVTAAGLEEIGAVLSPLGFERGSEGRARYFEHPECRWYVEFPPAPLSVGSKQIRQGEWAQLETDFGIIQILTPTQIVMDRLAAYFYWNDQPSFDQALMVCARQEIDWRELEAWIKSESPDNDKVERFMTKAMRES